MTTARPVNPPPASADPAAPFRLPDIPERHPDDMTSFKHLAATGSVHHLAQYLGHPDTTLVTGERYVVIRPTRNMAGSHYPDLLVAFDVNPDAYEERNGYVIDEQGKPPDFILEVASRHTARTDLNEKKDYYEGLRVGEYWLFDSEGEFYRFTLRGYQLEGDRYRPIPVEEISPGVFQGYSAALGLNLRAEAGDLGLYDPATGEHIPTFESQTARADTAEARADTAEARADTAEARADTAEARADTAEARADTAEAQVEELKAELHRLRQGR